LFLGYVFWVGLSYSPEALEASNVVSKLFGHGYNSDGMKG
jgi:hypothetical protein